MSTISTDHETEFVSVATVAKAVGLTPGRIRQMLAAKKIAFKKIGRQYLIPGSAVAAFVETFEPSNRGRPRTTTPKAKPKKRR